MNPNNIPFNALIVGPTSSGRTHYLKALEAYQASYAKNEKKERDCLT